jgi:DHA2 family multidrug resistance protein-like MFS transporter
MNGAARERLALASVLCAMAMAVLDAGILNVALPTVSRALGETPARTMLAVTSYQAALLIGLLPAAHIADRVGSRRLFVCGVTLFTGAALLCAVAPSLHWLAAARALQGLGGAAIMALGIALLRSALGAERLGAAIAMNALVVAACSALGPAVGALALSVAGWRWLFLLALPAGALALLAAPALPAARPAAGRRIDLAGVSLFAAAGAGLVAAAELARSMTGAATVVGLAAAAASVWLVARERGKAAPLLPLDLLALRRFRRSAAASALFFTAQSGGLLALPFYLQLSLGRSAAAAAFVLALWPAAVIATSRVANRLADRFGCEPVCAAGAVILAGGLAATASWPAGSSVAPIGGCALLCGIGFGLFQISNNRILFLSAPADRSAAAGGLQGTARLAGQTAGALLVGAILSSAPQAGAAPLAIGIAAVAALLAAAVAAIGAPPRNIRHADARPASAVQHPCTRPFGATEGATR